MLELKINDLQNNHTANKNKGGKVVTIEGRKIQHENKIAIDSLTEIEEETILDDLLENFVSEEFRILSYHIVKNKLFDAKMGTEDDYERNTPTASPSVSQEDEMYKLDSH